MRIFTRTLKALFVLLFALTACSTTGTNAQDQAKKPGDRPSTQVETPHVAPRPACAPGGMGDAARASDMQVDEECFISPFSVKRIDDDSYMLGLNCVVTPAKDTEHTATIRRGSDGYGVTLTPEEEKLIPDSVDCGGGDSVYVFLTVVH